ncbi:putative reverse transcriptase domain-containing protein [Tanacetum coccineum]
MKETGLSSNLAMCLQIPLSEEIKQTWTDEMEDNFDSLIEIQSSDRINGHFDDKNIDNMGDEVAEDNSAHASFMTRNNVSNMVDSRLAGYYRRFIENLSKIAKTLTLLTQKNKTYVWGDEQDEAFLILKEKLCNAPVLALPDGPDDCVVYYDASKQGFGYLKHHEEQIKDILNYLEELSFHRIRKMGEDNKLKTELEKVRSQIIKLQRKQLGQRDKITFAHYRIFDLEQIIEKIQARHQTNQEDL